MGRGRRQGVGLRKLIPSLQTPKTPKDCERNPVTLYTPKGCGESNGLRPLPPAPMEADTFNVVVNDAVRIVQILGIADNAEMVGTVEIDAANLYWSCTFCSEQPCFSNYVRLFC